MRRLLATAFAAALIAGGAACGNDDSDDQAADNTQEVCLQAEVVEMEQAQRLQEDLAALQGEDLPEEELQEQAVEIHEQALLGWSDGLADQAEAAEDPQLSETLTDLSDGVAELAPQLTYEALETGDLPGLAELDQIGQQLTELCQAALPEAPTPPAGPQGAPETP